MTDEFVNVELATGGVQRVSYRRAVSLVSRGLAVWAPTDADSPEAGQGTTKTQQDAQGSLPDPLEAETVDRPTPATEPADPEPDTEPVPKSQRKRAKKSASKLSAPARKGQEGDDAENKPLTSE